MKEFVDIVKKIDFADECNKQVSGNFGRTMSITMEEAFTFKQLLLFIKRLQEGGSIISSGDCHDLEISAAWADKRIFVDDENMGYIYFPEGMQRLHVTQEQINFICTKAHEITAEIWGTEHMECFGNLEVKMQGVVKNLINEKIQSHL